MANHPKLNSDQISEMKRLYEEGDKQADLAKRYEVSITTIRNKLGLGKPKEEPVGIGTFSPEVEPLMETVYPSDMFVEDKKKDKPKRRIVGVNV